MVYDPGALHIALASAVGDDSNLIAELRGAFLESAESLVDQMRSARGSPEWRMAALRLQGLAASFGAVALMDVAVHAIERTPGDAAVIADLRAAIAAFAV